MRKPLNIPREPVTPFQALITSILDAGAKNANVQTLAATATLLCDVGLGLLAWDARAWAPLMPLAFRRYILHETVRVLASSQDGKRSLFFSQRMKSFGFALPTLRRLVETSTPPQAAAAFRKQLIELQAATVPLPRAATTRDLGSCLEGIHTASRAFSHAADELRVADRLLFARLGGALDAGDIYHGFPANDPLAIADLVVTDQGTLVHLLLRQGTNVITHVINLPRLPAEIALQLDRFWKAQNLSPEHAGAELDAQVEAACSRMHQLFACDLSSILAKLALVQIVLIPDELTRRIPFHLAHVCDKEPPVPGVDTAGAKYLFERFPIEYSPALQAFGASIGQKRPRAISRVLSLADPKGDLPGARTTAAGFRSRLSKDIQLHEQLGPHATTKALSAEIDAADVALISTHGVFDREDPLNTSLDFADARWTVRDIIDRPDFDRHPVFLLLACEIASPLSGDSPGAGGLPAALLSKGAACVLGALWPVEDFPTAILADRFLAALTHPGYRPAAALFRAVRDLRRLSRNDALERARSLLADLVVQSESAGAPTSVSESVLLLDALVQRLEGSDNPQPFASPRYWGGFIIIGSGWSLPQGGVIGGAPAVTGLVTALIDLEGARSLLEQNKHAEACDVLNRILPMLEGKHLAGALEMLAWAEWMTRKDQEPENAFRASLGMLSEARFIAQTDGAEQLLRNIDATERKIRLDKE